MSTSDLSGRVALVTGSASGIGAACARTLADAGAFVFVADLSTDAGEGVVTSIVEGGGHARNCPLDVTDPQAVNAAVAAVIGEAGRLDIAVNNAGVTAPMTPVADVTDEHWRHVMAVNVDGVFYCLRAETQAMRATGGGSIINMSSVLGQVGREGSAAYVASKHAVLGLTRAAAIDHGPEGIRVNAVGPGFIRTPLLESRHTEAGLTTLASGWPLRRLGLPREIAEMVAWLASDASSFVTGAYFPVDGGYLAV